MRSCPTGPAGSGCDAGDAVRVHFASFRPGPRRRSEQRREDSDSRGHGDPAAGRLTDVRVSHAVDHLGLDPRAGMQRRQRGCRRAARVVRVTPSVPLRGPDADPARRRAQHRLLHVGAVRVGGLGHLLEGEVVVLLRPTGGVTGLSHTHCGPRGGSVSLRRTWSDWDGGIDQPDRCKFEAEQARTDANSKWSAGERES